MSSIGLCVIFILFLWETTEVFILYNLVEFIVFTFLSIFGCVIYLHGWNTKKKESYINSIG